MTDSSPLESGPHGDEEPIREFTTQVVRLTNETQMAVWGISYFDGNGSDFAYRVLQATPLPGLIRRGNDAAEYAVVEVAAIFGLPDFVFPPVKVPKRRGGTYEPAGDGIILCGDRGILIQSKSRIGQPKVESRDATWLKREIDTAYRQACGCLRKMPINPVTLANYRGRSFLLNGKGIDWTIVIVVEHPNIPDPYLPVLASGRDDTPGIVLTRRDWDFLHRHLRSNYAVIDYLQRVRAEQKPLGAEPGRYAEYALRDLRPKCLPIAELRQQYYFQSLPGDETAATDLHAHSLLRTIMDDIAAEALSSEDLEHERLAILATLDAIPVEIRTDLGKQLLAQLEMVHECPNPTLLESAMVCGLADARPYAVNIWVASDWSDDISPALADGTGRCRAELVSMSHRDDAMAISIVLIRERVSSYKWRILLKAQGVRSLP